jgi:hypothetical protein
VRALLFDLRKRDLFLLPIVVLLTVVALSAVAEIGSRVLYVENGTETCSLSDPVHGYRMAPNCVSHRKAAEGPEVEMAYNACGYRTSEPCGPKPPGTIRIAMLGSSTAQGFKMTYADSFAPLSSTRLTQLCGRPVEIQNMGVAGYSPLDSYLRVDEALALKPDLVLYVLVPFDLEAPIDAQRFDNRQHPTPFQPAPAAGDPPSPSLVARVNAKVNDLINRSRAVLVAEHFLFENDAAFVRLQLALGDKANYLRTTTPPAWQDRYAKLETMLAEMADKVHAAGLPFMVILGTQHEQLALLSLADPPPGVDAAAIGRSLAAIAQRHDILFSDTLGTFAQAPQRGDLFMPSDGHMTASGHAALAKALVARLTAGDVPAFAGCSARSTVEK